jgi:hypothetical protein
MTDKPETFEEWLKANPPPEDDPPKPKVLAIEVSERTFETAKAKPDKIRILTEDEYGNRVVGAAPIPRKRQREAYTPEPGDWGPRAAPERPVPVDNGGGAATGEMRWGHQPWSRRGIPTPRERGLRGDELVQRKL